MCCSARMLPCLLESFSVRECNCGAMRPTPAAGRSRAPCTHGRGVAPDPLSGCLLVLAALHACLLAYSKALVRASTIVGLCAPLPQQGAPVRPAPTAGALPRTP